MKLGDYLLDQKEFNWSLLLKNWADWLLPRNLYVWMLTRAGDLIVYLHDDSVHFLEVGCGRFTRIAESREDFFQKVEELDNYRDWFSVPFVDELVARWVLLNPGQCYGYRILPILGGSYEPENRVPIP